MTLNHRIFGFSTLVLATLALTLSSLIGEGLEKSSDSLGVLRAALGVRLDRETWGKPKKIGDSTEIGIGDVLEVDPSGLADVKLKNGVSIRLVGGTRLELGHDGVFLERGKIMVSVETRKSRFEVMTPLARVGVRGTVFRVSHAQRTEVHVFKGLVKVDKRQGRSPGVFLSRGQWAAVFGRAWQRLEPLSFDVHSFQPFTAVRLGNSKAPVNESTAEQVELQVIQGRLENRRDQGTSAFVDQAGFSVRSPNSESSVDVTEGSRMVTEADRRHENRLEELRSGRVQPGVDYVQGRRDLRQARETNSALSLRTRFQGSAAESTPARGGASLGRKRIDEELLTVRTFISRTQLERRRLVQELEQVDRERERLSQKIRSLESRLTGSLAGDTRTQSSLVSLRIQKRSVDQKRSSLVQRLSRLDQTLDESRKRLSRLLDSRSERVLSNQDLVDDARRLLR
jgi:hypothetical protein